MSNYKNFSKFKIKKAQLKSLIRTKLPCLKYHDDK